MSREYIVLYLIIHCNIMKKSLQNENTVVYQFINTNNYHILQ